MNRNGNPRNRSSRGQPQRDLGEYAGVQRDSYGRYDEDDWQLREQRTGERWGYGDFSAERGVSYGQRGDGNRHGSPHTSADAQRGDYRQHYGAERGHSHDDGYHGQGDEANTHPAASHPGRGGYGAGAHGGYAEHTSGQPGSGAYGHPRGRPGEDFRGRGPKNYVRSDERLREDISERLTADPDIDGQFEQQGLLPKNRFVQALAYARDRRAGLEIFLADPDVPIDNNHLERRLRAIPMGRKNWLFCWTELGAKQVGIIQSLLVTCRLHDIDPYTYLVDVLQRVGQHPAARVSELTPRLWKQHFAANPLRSLLHGAWR